MRAPDADKERRYEARDVRPFGRAGVAAIALAVGACATALAGACVDGTTPDCTLADAQCGPDGAVFDVSSPDGGDANAIADASDAGDATDGAATDAPVADAPSDAPDAD